MKKWQDEKQAREEIKALVSEYYHEFKENKKEYKKGDRITYAARVFDEKEMCALTDAMLDFWLTTGRFAGQTGTTHVRISRQRYRTQYPCRPYTGHLQTGCRHRGRIRSPETAHFTTGKQDSFP